MRRLFALAALLSFARVRAADVGDVLPSHRAETLMASEVAADRLRGVTIIEERLSRAEAGEWLLRLVAIETDDVVRARELRALGHLGVPSAVEAFARFSASATDTERRLSYLGLAVIASPEALELLVSGLLREESRDAALAALARVSAVPSARLLAGLEERHPGLDLVAVRSALTRPRAAMPMHTALRSPGALDCFVQTSEAPAPSRLSELRVALRRGTMAEQATAALGLADDPLATADLLLALGAESPAVRYAAALALRLRARDEPLRARLLARAWMEIDEVVSAALFDAALAPSLANDGARRVSVVESCVHEWEASMVAGAGA